ncbi:uncharacterized protein LOC134289404 [Aedes albopictus]|uniref:Uncharacterized protein n=1 Tax=Aedes albopictus TaxID=7160 RepID=A0ABM1XTD0_AEDAL
MVALPVQQLTPNLLPFSYVGVHYLGLFDVILGRRMEKRWIALFSCLVTRVVHLEVAHGLTMQSCLMAVHRFIGRNGWPVDFFSNSRTNLRGASKEVVEYVQSISDDCADQLTDASGRSTPWPHRTWVAFGSGCIALPKRALNERIIHRFALNFPHGYVASCQTAPAHTTQRSLSEHLPAIEDTTASSAEF